MKIRISLIFIALAFLFVSCGSSLSEEGNGYVSVDLSEVVQSISSRAAGDNKNVNVNLWTEGDFETSLTASLSASGTEEIIIKNIPLNSSISINIEASSGKKNYLGSSDKIIVKEGYNPVTITLNKTVPTTDIVLYAPIDGGLASLYLANSNGSNLQSPAKLVDTDYIFTDICFDAEGNLYYSEKQDGLFFHFYDGTVKTNKGKIRTLLDNQDTGVSSGKITYDFAKNQLWILSDGRFMKCSSLTQTDAEGYDYQTSMTQYNYRNTDTGAGDRLYAAFINNEIAYLVFNANDNNNNSSAPFFLLAYDISQAEVDEEDETQFNIESPSKVLPLCSGMDLSYYAEITDMLYQDGALYILLKDTGSSETNKAVSKGALIKYSLDSGNISSFGFASAKEITGIKTAAYCNGGYVYKSQSLTDYYYMDISGTYTFSAPYGETRASFFSGPEKFIAIKPKKLVIADTGLAFYTNSIGAVVKEKVNRVVEVDLKDLSIEKAKKTDLTIEFNKNYPSASISGSVLYNQTETGTLYTYNTSYKSFPTLTIDSMLNPVFFEE